MRLGALCGVVGRGVPCYDLIAVPQFSQSETQRLLASNVRRLRGHLKWTQEQAAEASGIAVRHFQKIEAGDVNVTVATLVRVAKAFRVPVKSLFEEQER
jgi:DNA-binding XRE family transcriptional regulator